MDRMRIWTCLAKLSRVPWNWHSGRQWHLTNTTQQSRCSAKHSWYMQNFWENIWILMMHSAKQLKIFVSTGCIIKCQTTTPDNQSGYTGKISKSQAIRPTEDITKLQMCVTIYIVGTEICSFLLLSLYINCLLKYQFC